MPLKSHYLLSLHKILKILFIKLLALLEFVALSFIETPLIITLNP